MLTKQDPEKTNQFTKSSISPEGNKYKKCNTECSFILSICCLTQRAKYSKNEANFQIQRSKRFLYPTKMLAYLDYPQSILLYMFFIFLVDITFRAGKTTIDKQIS